MVAIREAVPDDAPALGAIHVRAWQQAYRGGLMPDDYLDGLSVAERTTMWEQALANPAADRSARLVAADDAGRVLGFILTGPAGGEEPEVGEVYAVNVAPAAWGRGAGRALLAAGTDHLREEDFADAVLWVHPGNERARRFYERAGWRTDGVERREEVLGMDVPELRYRRTLA